MTFRGSNRGLLFATAAICFGLAAPSMAWAGEDGQAPIWTGLGDTLGVTSIDKVETPIRYGERPKLVLPPSSDLPPPSAAAAMSADWPHDPDVEKVNQDKEALLHRHQRSTSLDKAQNYGRPISPDLLRSDHAAPGTLGASDHCAANPRNCHWIRPDILEKLGLKKDESTIVAGQEPDREWLTDPPKGYRLPTRNTKADFEAPDHSDHGDQRYDMYKPPSQ
jgi:hypothetical protein